MRVRKKIGEGVGGGGGGCSNEIFSTVVTTAVAPMPSSLLHGSETSKSSKYWLMIFYFHVFKLSGASTVVPGTETECAGAILPRTYWLEILSFSLQFKANDSSMPVAMASELSLRFFRDHSNSRCIIGFLT